MPVPPEGFRHGVPIEIRFADLDSLAHLNNAKYLTYMEQARVRYFRELGLWDKTPSREGLILAKATLDFKLPLGLDDKIMVYTRVKRLGNKSMDSEQQIIRQDGAVAAFATVVLVVYNYEANASIRIPDRWRAVLTEYEPGLRR